MFEYQGWATLRPNVSEQRAARRRRFPEGFETRAGLPCRRVAQPDNEVAQTIVQNGSLRCSCPGTAITR